MGTSPGTTRSLWLAVMAAASLTLSLSLPFCIVSRVGADPIPGGGGGRHARAAMMIDMRGFPDTEGICRFQGFQRNETDCTQFYRCVRYNALDENEVYTIFRFMCGPMAVFDESRGLCTGPELANPPCTNVEQMAELFPGKPMGGLPSVTPPNLPITPKPVTNPPTRPTTPVPLGETSPTPTVTSEPVTDPSTPTGPTAGTPPTGPDGVGTPPSTTTQATTTEQIITEPTPTITTTVESTTAATEPTQTTTPIIVTETTTTEGTTTVSTVTEASTPVPTRPTGVAETIITTTEGTTTTTVVTEETPTPTQATTPVGVTDTTVTTTEGTTTVQTVTDRPTTPPAEETPPTQTTTPAGVTDTTGTVTESTTTAGTTTPDGVTDTIGTVTESTTTAGTTTPDGVTDTTGTVTESTTTAGTTTETTTPSVLTGKPPNLSGFLLVGDKNDLNPDKPPVTEDFEVFPDISFGLLFPDDGFPVTVQTDGLGPGTTFTIPPGAILVIETTQEGGKVTQLTQNGHLTTSSSTATFPSGTKFSVVTLGNKGEIVSTQTLLTTSTESKVTVPVSSVFGPIQVVKDKVVSLGKWTFSTQQLATTSSTSSTYGVFTETTTTTTHTITTTTTTITDSTQFIAGILILGGHQQVQGVEVPVGDVVVQTGDLVAIIPHSGAGEVTLIPDGPDSSSSFNIQPGTFLGILTSGPATITNLAQQSFTTQSTAISFPAGSTVSVMQVGTDGRPVRVTFVKVPTSFTIVTFIGSYVGTVQTSTSGSISSIGSGIFNTQQLTGTAGYVGIIDLGAYLTTFEVETLNGIVNLADPDYLGEESNVLTVQIPEGTTNALITSGEVKITEQDSTSLKESTLTIPQGSIFGIVTSAGPGQVSGLANGYFTTSATKLTFPNGGTFGIISIQEDGRMILQRTYITKVRTTIIVPLRSTFGKITLSSQGLVNGLGSSASFTTQYFLLNDANPATIGHFGTIQFKKGFQLPQAVVTSVGSTQLSTGLQSIIGVIQLYDGPSDKISSPSVPTGTAWAVFPPKGHGNVTVNEGGSLSTFTILPGQFLGLIKVQNLKVNELRDGFYSTETTTISFGPGTAYGVFLIKTNGQVKEVKVLRVSETDSTATLPAGSGVGIIQQSKGSISAIGGAPFTVKPVSSPGSSDFVGVWDIESTSMNSSLSMEIDTLSGLVDIGDATFLTEEQGADGQTVNIDPNTTGAVVASGEFKITEGASTSASLKQTVVTVPNGAWFGIVTKSNQGGQATGIVNGYFTTESTRFTFPSGATFGVIVIKQDGTMEIINRITTTVQTVIQVPVRSKFGVIRMSSQNVVVGLGSALFSTESLLIADSNDPDVPVMLANFGILQFHEQFQLPQSFVLSSTPISTGQSTIIGIIRVYRGPPQFTTPSLAAPPGSSLAVIPSKDNNEILVNEGAGSSPSTFIILPGRMFALFNVIGAIVTNLGDGLLTSPSTVLKFQAGTSYGVVRIGTKGQILEYEFNQTASREITVQVATGSVVGLIKRADNGAIVSIGGAPFATKVVSGSTATLGILDMTQLKLLTVDSVSTTPKPPSGGTPAGGPFTIDCTENALHQFPLDCSRFSQCYGDDDERTVYIFPCAPGLIFDEDQSTCLTPEESRCEDSTAVNATNAAASGGFFQLRCTGLLYRYPLNCNNFYQCFKDEGIETIYIFSCSAGLVFDDESKQCLKPGEAASCDTNDDIIRSPSIPFQLGQVIEVSQLIRSLAVEVKVASDSSKKVDITIHQQPEQPATAVKVAVPNNPRPRGGYKEPIPLKRLELPTSRKIDSNAFGARLVPRSRSRLISGTK